MSEKLVDKSCVGFTERLASNAAVPGGGGAAALVGAFGAALCSMAGALTLGRKKYDAVEADITALLTKSAVVQAHLLGLVDQDAAAFAPLSRAYSIPKDNPRRGEILEKSTVSACQAPLEIMRACCQAIELLEEMLDKGSAMLVSDVGCGALCCKAALESASLNIFVNTKALNDRKCAAALDDEADLLIKQYGPRAEQIIGEVTSRLRR